jgi:hypothetical protein
VCYKEGTCIPAEKGEAAMKRHQIILSTVFLILALGTLASQFAQDASTGPEKPNPETRSSMGGLVRTINTLEVTDFFEYGSYASWQTLLDRHTRDLNAWLARYYSREANTHFGEMPEILPGLNLRLLVQPNGQGYVVVLEDAKDKNGFALLSDERGVIRECKALQ